ncbi:hypothetical protein JZ751_008083 [Albula glossodonta]|uniref:Uncharacterized protein n=1 Tax=Albula glossodonta TaxID=121402 RepID=A0A8T2P9R1_9TELE|nr:hypothetical protein JZ751_008083 [Albula glossodonta]
MLNVQQKITDKNNNSKESTRGKFDCEPELYPSFLQIFDATPSRLSKRRESIREISGAWQKAAVLYIPASRPTTQRGSLELLKASLFGRMTLMHQIAWTRLRRAPLFRIPSTGPRDKVQNPESCGEDAVRERDRERERRGEGEGGWNQFCHSICKPRF